MQVHVLVRGQLAVEAGILKDDAEPLRTSSGFATGSRPSSAMVPLVGRSSVVSIWIVVVLPAPFGPRNAKISPAGTSNEMPSTALTSPKVLTRRCDVDHEQSSDRYNGVVSLAAQGEFSFRNYPHQIL